jgi:ABC-type antimicrobial peptide transport system permease subunit
MGLLLAAAGLYSFVSYAVAQRTQGFGIRIVLGARPRHVLKLVAGSVTALIAVGAVTGLAETWPFAA